MAVLLCVFGRAAAAQSQGFLAVEPDAHDGAWVGTVHGLAHVTVSGELCWVGTLEGKPIWSLAAAGNDLWLVSEAGLVGLLEGADAGLCSGRLRTWPWHPYLGSTLAQTASGAVWLVSMEGGPSPLMLDPTKGPTAIRWRSCHPNTPLSTGGGWDSGPPRATAVVNDDGTWLLAHGGMLCPGRIGEELQWPLTPGEIGRDTVSMVVRGPRGGIWVAQWSDDQSSTPLLRGLAPGAEPVYLYSKAWRRVELPAGEPAFIASEGGYLWTSSGWQGRVRRSGRVHWKHRCPGIQGSSNDVGGGPDGKVWFATTEGLFVCDPNLEEVGLVVH
jgi:hypothetical protein